MIFFWSFSLNNVLCTPESMSSCTEIPGAPLSTPVMVTIAVSLCDSSYWFYLHYPAQPTHSLPVSSSLSYTCLPTFFRVHAGFGCLHALEPLAWPILLQASLFNAGHFPLCFLVQVLHFSLLRASWLTLFHPQSLHLGSHCVDLLAPLLKSRPIFNKSINLIPIHNYCRHSLIHLVTWDLLIGHRWDPRLWSSSKI